MANRKISDLTALTAPVTGDLLPIVDISEAAAADKNKKITFGVFVASALSTAGIVVDGSGNVNIDSNTLYVDAVNNQVGIGTTASNANGGILQLSSGITFPATAVAASDANTLDDYEEGTWTPTQGGGLTVVGTFSSAGHYTKVGRQVTIQGYVAGSTTVAAAANAIICGGLPFTVMNVTGSHFIGGGSNASLSALINVWANQASTSIYAVTSMAATTGISFTVSYFTT